MSRNKSIFSKRCRDRQKQDLEQDTYFHSLHNFYSLLALNRFEWKNLPNNIKSRDIEKMLYQHGQVFFADDKELGLIALKCTPNGQFNIYDEPLGYQLIGRGYSRTFKASEGIRIIDNDNLIPPCITVHEYSEKIANVEFLIEKNIWQQKTPYIISTTKNTEFSLKNMFRKIANGEDQIYVDKTLDDGGDIGIRIQNLNAPYLVDKLTTRKRDLENELCTILGINNTNTGKKERMLVDEINVNNSQILLALDLAYKNRVLACDLINEKFNHLPNWKNIEVVKKIHEIETDFIGDMKEDNFNG